jgi:hypothetical protein
MQSTPRRPARAVGGERVVPLVTPIRKKTKPHRSSLTADREAIRNAARAVGFGDTLPPRRLRIWRWRAVRHNSLAGFASIELAIGLRIADLPVFRVGQTGPWVGTPRAAREVFAWRDRATSEAFSAAVLRLLLDQYPGALDPPAADPGAPEAR